MFKSIIFSLEVTQMKKLVYTWPKMCTHTHTHTDTHTGIRAHEDDERHSLLKIYIPLNLLKGFEKCNSRFYCERELETEENCNILTSTFMAISSLLDAVLSTTSPL